MAPATDPATLGPHAEPTWAPELPWLQPYPDHLLEPAAPSEAEPDAMVVSRETIELTYLAAIQHLPPRQRAVLILRDALGWSAKEVASLLEGSVASANSALQRARSTMRTRLPERRLDWAAITEPTDDERSVLRRYMEAYLRRHGESEYRLEGLDVLRIEDGEIVEITSFTPELLPAFGLPPTLDR